VAFGLATDAEFFKARMECLIPAAATDSMAKSRVLLGEIPTPLPQIRWSLVIFQ
jgi:hypothetical protein